MTLPDHRFDNPPIEVMSVSPRLEMLQRRLQQGGMRPVRAMAPIDPARSEPLLLDMPSSVVDQAIDRFVQDWVASASSRLLVVLGHLPKRFKALPVLHLKDIDQLPTLKARIAIRQREIQRQCEIELRAKTARKLGLESVAAPRPHAARVLYLGEGSPAFTPLKSALAKCQIETVAALTRLTAEDYLATGGFDAIILHPRHSEDEATQFLTRYIPTPQRGDLKLFLVEERKFTKELPASDIAKATSLLDATSTPEDIVATISDYLARSPGFISPVRRISSKTHDTATKLFSRTFLETHLEAKFAEADRTGMQISVLGISVSQDVQAFKHVAAIVTDHMRDADMAATLDQKHICIMLPATSYRGAVSLGRRIEAAVANQIEWRAAERRQFHTVKTLLGALTAKPTLRSLKSA